MENSRARLIWTRINETIPHGRIATSRAACEVMHDVLLEACGVRPVSLHIEIGVLWGGTAIFAALANPGTHIWGIDPISEHGHYGGDDPIIKQRPTVAMVDENLRYFGVEGRVSVRDRWSHPWPILAPTSYDTAFVDGDHTYEGVLRDFRNLAFRVSHSILFDNIEMESVRKAAEDFSASDDRWELDDQYKETGMGILWRAP